MAMHKPTTGWLRVDGAPLIKLIDVDVEEVMVALEGSVNARGMPIADFEGPTERHIEIRGQYARVGYDPDAIPPGTKLVLFTDELMQQLAGDGRVEWGQPDQHGRYTPTIYRSIADDPPTA